jgi:hypothetical protein
MTDRTSNQDLTDEDAANIGRALMGRLPVGYSWSDCPTEIVTDLSNEVHDLKASVVEACDYLRRGAALVAMAGDQNMALSMNRHAERILSYLPAETAQTSSKTVTTQQLAEALKPFAALGGPQDGFPAYQDLEDDVVVYKNSGECITAGDVRRARDLMHMVARWQRRAVETTTELCPNCGKDEVGTFTADDSFLYGSSNPIRLVAKDVLFFRCMACHLEYTDEDGEEKRMEAIRAHLTTRSAAESTEHICWACQAIYSGALQPDGRCPACRPTESPLPMGYMRETTYWNSLTKSRYDICGPTDEGAFPVYRELRSAVEPTAQLSPGTEVTLTGPLFPGQSSDGWVIENIDEPRELRYRVRHPNGSLVDVPADRVQPKKSTTAPAETYGKT